METYKSKNQSKLLLEKSFIKPVIKKDGYVIEAYDVALDGRSIHYGFIKDDPDIKAPRTVLDASIHFLLIIAEQNYQN